MAKKNYNQYTREDNKKTHNVNKSKEKATSSGFGSFADAMDKEKLEKLKVDTNVLEIAKLEPIPNNIKSPYNFVGFDNRIGSISNYEYNELPNQNTLQDKEHYNGTIDYTIINRTPLIICSEGNKKIRYNVKNAKNQFIIPGNTIRGLIRQNCKILSLSSVSDDIESDRKYTFREVVGESNQTKGSKSKLKSTYDKILDIQIIKGGDGKNSISIAKNVKAGYITCQNKEYYIQPAKEIEGRSFLTIHELSLRKLAANISGINYLYKEWTDINGVDEKNRNKAKTEFTNNNRNWNKSYKPYIKENIMFDNKGKKIVQLSVKTPLKNKGTLLCSGFIKGKVRHIIMNDIDNEKTPLSINNDDIIVYQSFLKLNKIDKSSYYGLPEEGKSKPCFYIEYDNKLYFGFTQYLRLFYKNPIKMGIPHQGKQVQGIDYTSSIFGFTNNGAYKSRISFCDAISNNCNQDSDMHQLVAGTPKPTFYKYYLDQKNITASNYNDYNDNQFRLRGTKQYWLKCEIDKYTLEDKPNMITSFYPLKEGSTFKGRVYFNQLTRYEIGLILWALELDENCNYNIGFGKAHGYGRIKIHDITLSIEDNKLKYDECRLDDYNKIYKDNISFIDDFKNEMFKRDIDIEKTKSIKEFINMKTFEVKDSEKERFKYLPLSEHKKVGVLPEVDNYIGLYAQKIEE